MPGAEPSDFAHGANQTSLEMAATLSNIKTGAIFCSASGLA
jgi:hypothetical protein